MRDKRSLFVSLSSLLFVSLLFTFFNCAEASGAEAEYEVLSPWAEVDPVIPEGLQPRLDDLNGKTIGMYYHFKNQCRDVLEEVEARLKSKYPNAKFKYYQYPIDTAEIIYDEKYKASFHEWLNGVDAVITSYGDFSSCTMYLAYNTAAMEKLGKPAVILLYDIYLNQYKRGAAARGVPGLRGVTFPGRGPGGLGGAPPGAVTPEKLDEIIKGLTAPLTAQEKNPPYEPKETKRIVFKGNLEEVNNFFYQNGWTNGTPIIPPTEEAVNKMLEGTDLPRDYVVAKLPPMEGKATVEKIAINAVMAGCLPTYMPVLIAAVKGMVDPGIHLEGWTCSAGSWAPLIIVSGEVGRDLNFNTGQGLLSPYYKPQSTIPHAFALMIMNISGVRPKLEDGSNVGHQDRFGICIAEDLSSPWGPLHTDYGMDKDDSAVTLSWPASREGGSGGGNDLGSILSGLLDVIPVGFFHGATYIMDVNTVQKFVDAGWSRRDVIDYIVEYCRRPASEVPLEWLIENNHFAKIIQEGKLRFPEAPGHSTRVFFDDEHLLIAVCGVSPGYFAGGGDHGGPSCTKIDLPANWKELVNKYKDMVPEYLDY